MEGIDSWADEMDEVDACVESGLPIPAPETSLLYSIALDQLPEKPPFRLFVSGFTPDASAAALAAAFGQLQIEEILLRPDRGGRPSGQAAVDFISRDHLEAALKLDTVEVCGRRLRLQLEPEADDISPPPGLERGNYQPPLRPSDGAVSGDVRGGSYGQRPESFQDRGPPPGCDAWAEGRRPVNRGDERGGNYRGYDREAAPRRDEWDRGRYPPPGGSGFMDERRPYSRNDSGGYDRDGPRDYVQNGPMGHDRDGPRSYDRGGPMGHDRDGPRSYDRGGPMGHRDGPRSYDRGGPMGHDRDGPRSYDRGGPMGHDRDGPRSYDRGGHMGHDRVGPRSYDREGPMGHDRDGTRGYDRGGPRGYDRDGSMGYSRDGPRGHDRDGPRPYDRGGPGAHGRDGSMNYERVGPRYESGPNREGPRFGPGSDREGRSYGGGPDRNGPRYGSGPDRGGRPPAGARDSEASAVQRMPDGRPKLNLKPRTVPTAEIGKPAASSSIFGGAKPVDTAAREREIEERLRARERGLPRAERQLSLRHRSGDSTASDGRRPRLDSQRSECSRDGGGDARSSQDSADAPNDNTTDVKVCDGSGDYSPVGEEGPGPGQLRPHNSFKGRRSRELQRSGEPGEGVKPIELSSENRQHVKSGAKDTEDGGPTRYVQARGNEPSVGQRSAGDRDALSFGMEKGGSRRGGQKDVKREEEGGRTDRGSGRDYRQDSKTVGAAKAGSEPRSKGKAGDQGSARMVNGKHAGDRRGGGVNCGSEAGHQ